MKRCISFLIPVAMIFAFAVPAVASQTVTTPEASEVEIGTPQASPATSGLFWEGTNEDGDELLIEVTELTGEVVGHDVVDEYDPESGEEGLNAEFVEERDAADDCRLFEFDMDGESWLFGLCATDDEGLVVIGTEEDAVTYVQEQFVNGETDLVPEGYEEAEDVTGTPEPAL